MASAGGGHIIYGIAEAQLDDGTAAASQLMPLADGSLYERLNNVLDSRGEPRLPFEIHSLSAAGGGSYLVVEVFGHRRPHRASDGHYYVRTNRPNTVLRLEGENVIVGTTRSPSGQPVPIKWVQDAMDELSQKGELAIEVSTVGYRSAFIGAVLATLPDAVVIEGTRRIRLDR